MLPTIKHNSILRLFLLAAEGENAYMGKRSQSSKSAEQLHPIHSQAIQDLLDELEASKQSRLRVWNVLIAFSGTGKRCDSAIGPKKTFDADFALVAH